VPGAVHSRASQVGCPQFSAPPPPPEAGCSTCSASASRRCTSNRAARGRTAYIESFNGKLRDELLNVEIFDTLLETKLSVKRYRMHYNTVRPHSALGYRPPAPAAIRPRVAGRERWLCGLNPGIWSISNESKR